MKPIIVDSRSVALEFFRNPREWYYSSWTEDKYREFLKLNAIYPISLYMQYLQDQEDMDAYLDRYGMDYSDIKNPYKLSTTNSSTNLNRYALNFVSSNVKRLYH